MSKPNAEYWAERMQALEAILERRSNRAQRYIEKAYKKAIVQINRDISAWYVRYATENGISLAEAKRQLSARELAEFRWTVEEYIAHGRENAISGQWMKELERASVRVHVSRLESLKIQLLNQAENFIAGQYKIVKECLEDTYREGYYRTLFEINKKYAVKADFMTLNQNKLDLILRKPWNNDGLAFSERIWGNQRARLVGTLQDELTHQIITGKPPREYVKAIQSRFSVSRSSAERIVRTESMALSSQAKSTSFREVGVKKFQVISGLDLRTCTKCGYLDGEIYPMADFIVGSTAPPFHPNCRCTTAPYIEGLEDGERLARKDGDPKGAWIRVPENMRYPEWYEKYVEKQ